MIAKIKQLNEACYLLQDETLLDETNESVDTILKNVQGHLQKHTENGLLIRSPLKSNNQKIDKEKFVPLLDKGKKHPYAGRYGEVADMMKQYYHARLVLPSDEVPENSTVIEEMVLDTIIDDNPADICGKISFLTL